MQEKVNIENLLSEGNSVSIEPIGTSMYPLFVERNDRAIIVSFGKFTRRVRRGDVCVYRRPDGGLVIHRIYKASSKEVYFVGDHQTEIEGPLSLDCIIGVMVAFRRKNKEYSVSNPIYIILSRIWLFIRPIRLKLIKLCSIVKKCIN